MVSYPGKLKKQSDDEIGEMVESLNNLTDNLRNTREFAIEVGKGNFNTEINVFGNKGDMGGSLIQMKNQLEEVAHNQEFQKLEEKQRTWIAEGTALFARLLRTNNDEPG
jgi:methyl-accepting chemotaxis protein